MYVRTVLVLTALCADFLDFTEALKPGDPGVCVAKSTHTQRTRWKTFYVQSKRMCGKKKCVVKKSRRESYAVKSQPICCAGWEYRSEEDSCSPLCSTGCAGGRCVSPDVCRCEPPALLDEEHRNACILPTCEPPCVNGVCVADNKCECNAGHVQYNATHCYHCEPGYTIGRDFSCVPVCDRACANGNCIGPNVCGCIAGYSMKDTFTCEPVCETACSNSVCTAPNVCSCLDGYAAVNGSCAPLCDSCGEGHCAAPNVCVCDEGYTNSSGRCEPVCDDGCINGVCVEPNLCSCNEGYVADGSGTRCVRECAAGCGGACDGDGKCLDCSVPFGTKYKKSRGGRGRTVDMVGKLMCCDGWTFDFASKKCVYYCILGCERGKCIGPNKCSCEPPYELVDGKCVDIVCDPPCSNGKCAGNNTCLCDPGHEKLNTTHCAPICAPGYAHPCGNGTCAPGTDPFACVPKCEPECENGACVEPGVCKCNEGYKNESNWSCAPVCDNCQNGNCVAPNVCECYEGYSRNLSEVCTPICEDACSNGYCSAPNVCTCNAGYLMDNSTGCVPVCTEPCVNGYCVSPERCECNPGYEKSNGSTPLCRKQCAGPCEHGICTVYGTCECDRDYKLQNGTCERISIHPVDCESCSGNCSEGSCRCADGGLCYLPSNVESAEVASSSRLAGLELSWVVGGAVGLLLIILVIAIFGHMWRRRKDYGAKSTDEKGNINGSVVYTVANTLLNIGEGAEREREYDAVNDPDPALGALLNETNARDEKTYK